MALYSLLPPTGNTMQLGSPATALENAYFNPASAGPALILGANALTQLVVGLNADLLDGNEAAAFDAAGAAAAVAGNLSTHAGLTTTAHGGIVASTDARLTDARTPLAHAASHAIGVADTVFPTGSALQLLRRNAANNALEFATPGSTGDVYGPASAVDSNFAAFDTTTGKLIKDSGKKAGDFAPTGDGAAAVATHVGLSDPHTQYQKESEKGAVGGYASLDGAGLVPSSQMPPIAITEFLGVVASEVAMLALTGEKGDWCVRSDAPTRTFIIIANDGHLITDWQALYTPAAPVLSVNTQTGAVSLTYSDVGACSTSDARLSDARTPTAHQLDSATYHTVSGLTAGHVLTALTPTTFGFSAPAVPDLSAAAILLPTTSARNVIQPSGAAIIPLTVKGFASQSASLQEWQDSAGTALAYVGPVVPFSMRGTQSTATLGAEKVTNGTFASDTGWTHSANWTLAGDGFAVHTAGNTDALSQNIATVTGTYYALQITTTNVTGSPALAVTVGSVLAFNAYGNGTWYMGFLADTTGSVSLALTPASAFDGKVSVVTCKPIAGYAASVMNLYASDGTLCQEIRSGGAAGNNAFFGYQGGAAIYGGVNSVSVGSLAMQQNISGSDSVGVGYKALNAHPFPRGCTAIGSGSMALATRYGNYNTAVGVNTLGSSAAFIGDGNVMLGYGAASSINATSASYNIGIGYNCFAALVNGQFNVGIGSDIFSRLTSGQNNVAIGALAGQYITSGGSNTLLGQYSGGSLATASGGVFLGYGAGYFETASNKFFVDNQTRAGEADGRAKALMYGVFDAAMTTQFLTVNGRLGINTSTFGTVSKLMVNAAITADNAACAQITATADANKALVIQRFSATQTANLLEFQTSAGAARSFFSASGALSVNPTATANAGAASLNVQGVQSISTLGAELVTNGTFASDTGWTHDASWTLAGDGFAAHTAGTATTLTQNISTLNGYHYVVQFTVTASAGSALSLTIGTAVVAYGTYGNGTYYVSFKADATGSVAFTFTPVSAFDGKVSAVSCKQFSANASSVANLYASDGTLCHEMRTGGPADNSIYLGYNAGSRAYTGAWNNVALGYNAMRYNLCGYGSVAIGQSALSTHPFPINNVAIGSGVMSGVVKGNYNVCIGSNMMNAATGAVSGNVLLGFGVAAYGATTAGYNVGLGYAALATLSSGSQNVAVGMQVAYKLNSSSNNTLLGYRSGYEITSGGTHTMVGAYAGYAGPSTVTGNVFLGYAAGYYETGGSKFFVDNQTRTDEATSRISSLLYGSFNATVASQFLTVNGKLGINTSTFGTVCKLMVNAATTVDNATCFQITATADANKALVIQRFSATQTAALLETQTSAGTPLVQLLPCGCISLGNVTPGTSGTKLIVMGTGVAPSTSPADAFQMYSADQAAGNACAHFRTENGGIVKLFTGAALTTQLTGVTASAPGTPDYAIQDLTLTGYGFATADEGQTVLSVIANLQTRVAELEARLQGQGLLT